MRGWSAKIKFSGLSYYVDPGGGFVFAQNTSIIWALLLAFLGSFYIFFKNFFKFFKKFLWILLLLGIIFILKEVIMMKKKPVSEKVIILGVDAMDPSIAEKLMSEGKMPNLARLKSQGNFERLRTTVPAESVVAWTSFATGLPAAGHGIFDFVMRRPNDYAPYLSLNEITSSSNGIKIKIRKKGENFWSKLSKEKIPCFIYFCPNTFPPEPVQGVMLSGMGVPDLSGTMGKFTFYTSKELNDEDQKSRGRIVAVGKDRIILTDLFGPKVSLSSSQEETRVLLKVIINAQAKQAELIFQKNKIVLKQGDWSKFYKVSFKLSPLKSVSGIVRFYLKSAEPEFELYASPINFDPEKPVFPISYPEDYAKKISRKIGLFYTQGMPCDTWALSEGRLDEKAFLNIVDEVYKEKKAILNEELKNFKAGFFFLYFDTLDAVQHMFWRYRDPAHPLFDNDPVYKRTIDGYYEKIDYLIGDILKNTDKHTILIVISDHGFSSFNRSVNLNNWLMDNGFLSLREGRVDLSNLDAIDWPNTKAYALGFGGIYINRIGREGQGIVEASQATKIRDQIASGLSKLTDPKTGQRVVSRIYLGEDFSQVNSADGPDLFVGFSAGYRASWQTALGGLGKDLLEDNKKKWSGDHLIDPAIVPGVFFSNKKTGLKDPSIEDIASFVIKSFNSPK